MKFAFYNGSDGVYRLASNVSPSFGGSTKQQWYLAQTIIEHGHEVVCITPTKDSDNFQREIDGIQFVPSPPKTTNLQLHHILAHEDPDWLYWRTNSLHLGPCFFIARQLGINLIYACASDKDCTPSHALNPYSQLRHLWPLYQWGLDQADHIFVQHTGQHQLLSERYAAKANQVNNISLIPNIDTPSGDEPYIAWIGNLRYEKRPDLLIEIAQQLPECKFIVCGKALKNYRSEQGYTERVHQMLCDLPNIDYRGAVPPDEVIHIVSHASLLLSTSIQEGLPNTMLEAWSVGVPVISLELDIGGLITRHNLGVITNSVEDTVMSIRQHMDAPQELARMGENGVEYVMQHHAPEVVYQQLASALHI